tara:strand:+ start:548 stop:769 length:222 start_codon:yes stop_codon:yes gene_type:complete
LKIEKNYRNGNKVVYGSDTEENKTHEEFDESAETVRSEAPKNILLSNNSIYVDADGYTHIVEKQFIKQGKKQI